MGARVGVRRWGPSVGNRLPAILITLAVVITSLGGCSTDDLPEAAGTEATSTSLAPVEPSPTPVGPSRAAVEPSLASAELSLLSAPVDLRSLYNLPPLRDGADDEAGRLAQGTQVRQRAERLGLGERTAHEAWSTAADTVTTNREQLPALLERSLPNHSFEGTRLSELGELLADVGSAHVTVVRPTLVADTSLTISGQEVSVDFAGAVIQAGSAPPAWTIEIRGARNVAVLNAEIAGGANGILVVDSTDVSVAGNELHDLSQNGIVVSGGSHASIRSNRLHALQRSGIVLHGDVTDSLLEGNEIHDLTGHSNWHAGILIAGRNGDPAGVNPYEVEGETIVDRLRYPSRNVIVGNDIRDGRSSGIYNDGGIANVLVGNDVVGNAKEGICLDNGATANVVAGNAVTGNGNRWGQPDEVLEIDSVLDEGRAADGTAIAKLPGISIDNALYNVVHANTVAGNFGGGIKMVRTSFFNVITGNVLTDNNLGRSHRFRFFGIELGAAVPDFDAPDLDFVGSSGNVVVANQIHGDHDSGVYVAAGSVQNDIIGNDIDGVAEFEIERPS